MRERFSVSTLISLARNRKSRSGGRADGNREEKEARANLEDALDVSKYYTNLHKFFAYFLYTLRERFLVGKSILRLFYALAAWNEMERNEKPLGREFAYVNLYAETLRSC